MTEEEEKAVEYVNSILEYKKLYGSTGNIEDFLRGIDKEQIKMVLNLIQKKQEEKERYKRLAEQNLKDSEEFKNNMCEHRCIKNNEILELQDKLEKKDKIIDEMAPRVFLTKEEREEMKEDIWNNPKHKGFADFVKRYIEKES